ncbi:MAG TPA: hypothetical protein DCY13_21050 [Verrucomicrobiales bacterium]|nr:hypothetical protein [Verrucomicrobiales bacterium]
MSTVQEIEKALPRLTREEMEHVRELIDEQLEAQLELADDVVARIEQSKAEIAAGEVTTRQP